LSSPRLTTGRVDTKGEGFVEPTTERRELLPRLHPANFPEPTAS
jgi:hypothetical protein